jgi:hypothetical protein
MYKNDTERYIKEHIKRVRKRLLDFISELYKRVNLHDVSKLDEPEYSLWLKMDEEPRYKYGTKEYKDKLARNKHVFELHYKHNSHHPEHYPNGILDMDLIDLIEMLIDWISYKDDISIKDAIELVDMQSERYGLSEDVKCILKNTLFRHYSRLSSIVNEKPLGIKDGEIYDKLV